ncbi:hypothetical protein Pmar_PMAR015254 [Perkinsus marinus ATCC 50983]|uniref:Uncharacterized protein n=1 Tax=Perkinsus marinus (strain ATCC 50983 / TXsc) TaxID=423536 RepID=C5KL57_PERM5|nr:hypothetical protein Pmar_PMAR015254 [Perkinsus marinus ATCC 50983]EER14730.1 hypothetical protein Pmar_PMAR015254 [Perkinsus marinus ATCC 50983]|eukprot:XP_002782934.1 hypothetical protein Pmar_PMAR015254 [Perkinsus marinus ATCC 50983]
MQLNAMKLASGEGFGPTARSRLARMRKRGLAKLRHDVLRRGDALTLEQFIRVMLLALSRDEDGYTRAEKLSEEQELALVKELHRW